MAISQRQKSILKILSTQNGIRISEIRNSISPETSIPTLNRDLRELVELGYVIKQGSGRNISYTLSSTYVLLNDEIGDSYFDKEIDQRDAKKKFDPTIFQVIESNSLFTNEEAHLLDNLHTEYLAKIKTLSPVLLQKETERLSIELSWKSSQIEGNTYSLLETELLLSQHVLAKDKEKSEAIMLLNHKTAIDHIFERNIVLVPLKVSSIEDIHYLLTKDLGVSRNLRKRPVGITGTTYTPPDNEFQIREYLERSCEVINKKELVFEKALLAILLISWIQPFEDGNKRTDRITSNGILIDLGYCPLSYRGVQPIDYKKAMVLFYEQNNISAFKKLFIEQYEFAVKNYF
jgi:Fic family protein